MKIVLLHGQDHKGSTYHIARQVADKIQGANEITEFFFPRDLPYFCKGCYTCIEDDTKCPYYEAKHAIFQKLEESDVIICSTPVYCMHVSAALKSFFELTFDNWMVHRPKAAMFSKRAVIVSTAAGSSAKHAMKDVEDSLFNLGIPSISKFGLPVHAMNWDGINDKTKLKIEKATTRLAKKLSTSSKPRVGLKTKFMFNLMGFLQKKDMGSSPVEKEYWESQGWLGKARPWKNA